MKATGCLLYRRMMARIAREIARAERALGLVTGDSVSQVASQTLHNLMAIDQGIDMPVYRPLAGDDKAGDPPVGAADRHLQDFL